MHPNAAWEFAKDILHTHFQGVTQPMFFGHELTPEDHTTRRGKPRPSILATIDLLKKLGGKTIVEIGCMRQPLTHELDEFNPVCCNDGHSTAFWAMTGLAVHSVDIDPACCQVAAETCGACPNVSIYCADGIEFLRQFSGVIDLLYLDAWDAIEGIPYAEKHLEAFQVARPKLARRSLILIDDTDVAFGGKGRQAIPAIIRDGYDLLFVGRQTLLLRLD
ncbi:MAG: hypothetical protein HBSAPP03_04790 [Phycisphaerae bacterium]|nr:MAG: hypothetical protein HBSAPP03_04790 [Phycisphaerae bacterium]